MDIKDIYDFMDRAQRGIYDEVHLEIDNVKLTLKKNSQGAQGNFKTMQEGMANSAAMAPKSVSSDASDTSGTSNASGAAYSDLVAIKSPFVGTFYRASSPDDKPYVMVGQSVKKGDVVGIIEAMKLMNEITATCDGVVEAIKAEDGEMVDYNRDIVMLKIS